jgi:FkbM family methyltransferase
MPSQYGEHEFIEQHFAGRFGRFLDVGAYDGVVFSNTRGLVEAGWGGVCVEPNPLIHECLYRNTRDFPNVLIFPVAIVPTIYNPPDKMWVHQDMLSTLTQAHHDKIKKANPAPDYYKQVPVITQNWAELVRTHPGPYDFVNIDVEGLNWDLLQCFPFEKIKAEMICFEIDPESLYAKFCDYFGTNGYTKQKRIGCNLLAWRDK